MSDKNVNENQRELVGVDGYMDWHINHGFRVATLLKT